MKRNLQKLSFLFRLGLVVLIGTLTYWQIVRGPQLAKSPNNPRLRAQEKQILRGQILDRRGKVIATTKEGRRQFFGPQALGPTIGYLSERRGASGIEAAFSSELLGELPAQKLINFKHKLFSEPAEGSDLVLTLDLELCTVAAEALGSRRGAVVGIDVETGEILVLASSPGFDPIKADAAWQELIEEPGSPLLNRPLQGLYPPGSVFKPIVALGVLHWHLVEPDEKYHCSGSLEVEGQTIRCFRGRAHGEVTLEEAMAVSCNVTFVKLAQRLGKKRFLEMVTLLNLERAPKLGVPVSRGKLAGGSSLPQLAIGQGSILATPLQMAQLAATIGSGGMAREPYLWEQVKVGQVAVARGKSRWQKQIESSAFQRLRPYLTAVVERGTGRAARDPSFTAAGKTGTADNPHGKPHAWFVGYAPAERPKLALAVIVENSGEGGAIAAPVARQIFAAAKRGGYFSHSEF